jgi:hypothetical protein
MELYAIKVLRLLNVMSGSRKCKSMVELLMGFFGVQFVGEKRGEKHLGVKVRLCKDEDK